MAEISVRLSRENGKSDAGARVKGRKPQSGGDAVGQAQAASLVCWFCWAVNEIAVPDATTYVAFTCWNCGNGGTI